MASATFEAIESSILLSHILLYSCECVCGYYIKLSYSLRYSWISEVLEEASTAIVPIHRIKQKETLEYGGSCGVLWSDKKVYKAFLIYSGTNTKLILYNYG